jgi:hypothetical protein
VKALARIGVVVAALGLAGAAAGAAAKPTLTVVVSSGGSVTSSPSGIHCRPACKIHARKGQKITLTAAPNDGYEFSHWSAPCGTNFKCTVKMTGSRVVHAFFKAEPPAPAPAPPPPPPPPPARPGNYAGTYTDGTFFKFVVDSFGANASTFSFDLNGECSDGGTSYGSFRVGGPFAIHADGSFSGSTNITFSTGTAKIDVTGTASSSGTASGTLAIALAFNNGIDCTSKGTWTAQDQS